MTMTNNMSNSIVTYQFYLNQNFITYNIISYLNIFVLVLDKNFFYFSDRQHTYLS